LILDSKLLEEVIFRQTDRTEYNRNILEEIRDAADQEGIIFDFHGPGLDNAPSGCRENVRRACVINVEGEVVPCVFTNPVLSSHYIFEGESVPITTFSFGNIQKESLTRIWKKKEYARFRELFDPETRRKPGQTRSERPQSCVKCYKRLGV
jgi:MoaA/NifB/PqqE/SkfB family radical SAM enzyme